MATKTIKGIGRELNVAALDLINGYIEGQDLTGSTGSYKVSLSVVRDKFLEEIVTGVTYQSGSTDTIVVPYSVGGIVSGTTRSTLTGKTFTSMFDELLFPTINPTFIDPFSTIEHAYSSLLYIGLYFTSLTFTITYNAGKIQLPSQPDLNRGGIALTYNFIGTGLTLMSDPSPTRTISYTIIQGYQTWTGSTNYAAGPQPVDNKGNNYGSALSAGTTIDATTRIEGIYPLYGTTVDIATSTPKSVSMITGNNIEFNMVSQTGLTPVQSFDIPDAWLSSRSLVDVETYNTISSTWNSTGLGQWTTSSTTYTISGNIIGYRKYIYNGAARGNTKIRLVF